MILEKEGDLKKLSNFCKANITYINDNGNENLHLNIEKESIQVIVREKCTELGIDLIDIENNLIHNRKLLSAREIIDAN